MTSRSWTKVPETWPPEPYHVPVFLAGVNTIILVTSSFTVHWATHSVRTNHRPGLRAKGNT